MAAKFVPRSLVALAMRRSSQIAAAFRNLGILLPAVTSPYVRVRLIFTLILITAASALTALGPLALQQLVDRLSGQKTGMALSAGALIAAYAISQWSSRAATQVQGLVYARAERRVCRSISEKIFAHLMQLPFRYHVERRTGALSQTLDNGLNGFQQVSHTLIFTVLPVFAEIGTIVLVLVNLRKPQFVLLFVVAMFFYSAAFFLGAKRVVSAARGASAAQVDANAVVTDSLLNYETVKYFAAEQVVQDRVSKVFVRTEDQWIEFYRRFAISGLGVATIFAGFLACTIVLAVRDVQAGRMSIGTFFLVNSYMLQIVRPVETLGYAVQTLSQGFALLEGMFELLRENPESASRGRGGVSSGGGSLEFQGVSLSYRTDRVVLRDVSFRVGAGKTLAVVGASGSGKSTLVRLLVRLLDPDCGSIFLGGQPICALGLDTLRKSIAVVPQETVLFNESIGYNIAFGRPGCTEQEVERAAKLAQLHDFIVSLPEKYETLVGERGVKLSGGERQRISIARAAIKRPQIYVFDEATSSLDSSTEGEIVRSLRRVSRGSTTLIIAHRLSTVVHADEIVVLEQGTVAECGTHSALLSQGGKYAELWSAQERGHNLVA